MNVIQIEEDESFFFFFLNWKWLKVSWNFFEVKIISICRFFGQNSLINFFFNIDIVKLPRSDFSNGNLLKLSRYSIKF